MVAGELAELAATVEMALALPGLVAPAAMEATAGATQPKSALHLRHETTSIRSSHFDR